MHKQFEHSIQSSLTLRVKHCVGLNGLPGLSCTPGSLNLAQRCILRCACVLLKQMELSVSTLHYKQIQWKMIAYMLSYQIELSAARDDPTVSGLDKSVLCL